MQPVGLELIRSWIHVSLKLMGTVIVEWLWRELGGHMTSSVRDNRKSSVEFNLFALIASLVLVGLTKVMSKSFGTYSFVRAEGDAKRQSGILAS